MMKIVSFLLILGWFASAIAQDSKASDAAGYFGIRAGVNVSHWLSQSEKRGDARKKSITREDFDAIASMGFDHVRIPVDEVQMWDSTGNKEAEAFALLHDAIHWAFGAHLRVIVDLHILR